jgi:predicted dehydrogenase
VVGSEGRFVLIDACEHLTFYPRFSKEIEKYDYVGGMMNFGETFGSRISEWVEQNTAQIAPDKINASGADALHVQHIIEAIIQSWETGTVVTL